MPAITDTPPEATPKSIDIAAPNSNAASRICTPCGSSVTPKKPPPPNIDTVSRNGCSRVQKLKRTDSGCPMKGTVKPAPSDRLLRLKRPIASDGSATEKPASMPCGVMSRCGGSEKPSSGIRSRNVSTKDSGPTNLMSVSSTSTLVFDAESTLNSIFSKFSSMKLAGAINTRSKWCSPHSTRIFGGPPLFLTRASTVTMKACGSCPRTAAPPGRSPSS